VKKETKAVATATETLGVTQGDEPTPKPETVVPVTKPRTEPTEAEISAFLGSMKLSNTNALGQSKLFWKDGVDRSKWRVRWVRQTDVAKSPQALDERGMVEVRKSGTIMGVKFTDLFEDKTFDDAGERVTSKYKHFDKENNCWVCEMRPFLQRIEIHEAVKTNIRERVEARTEKKLSSRKKENEAALQKVAQDSGVRSGGVSISQEHFGDSDSGYNGI
jgi:hypothetical protein